MAVSRRNPPITRFRSTGLLSHEEWFVGLRPTGRPPGMSPLEELIDDVEVSISDSIDSLDDDESARLYAEILDVEQRLGALRDALTLLAAARP
jgi:hypothetical protein